VIRAIAGLLLALALPGAAAQDRAALRDEEQRAVLAHGPWPAPWKPDPSNRASGKPEAIVLGERLFFEPRLSAGGKVLCSTCHAPFQDFQDARARGFGLAEGDRNTQGLLNIRYQRWFGWDGAGDSLWAQSLRPILDRREMDGSVARTAKLLRGDA
jgi:cytochrome c peroxidase